MRRRGFLTATLAAVSFIVSAASSVMRATISEILPVKPRPGGMRLPPIPNWNKTTDDIDGADFFRRAEDCERSLLPRDLVFPREGQIWEAVRDCEIHGLQWLTPDGAPLWAGTHLRKGERVRILATDNPRPLHVRFRPLSWDELGDTIEPTPHRSELCMRTARIGPVARQEHGFFADLFRPVDPQ